MAKIFGDLKIGDSFYHLNNDCTELKTLKVLKKQHGIKRGLYISYSDDKGRIDNGIFNSNCFASTRSDGTFIVDPKEVVNSMNLNIWRLTQRISKIKTLKTKFIVEKK